MPVEDIAVLFSGGTDSTLAAALSVDRFQKIRLLSYDRFGLSATGNTGLAARALIARYGEEKISHEIFSIDQIFKHVSYERYLVNVVRHGFFNLSTCGLCKLAMHVRTIVYCVDNEVKNVCDGANKGMDLFPAQMVPVIEETKKLYHRFGVRYENPVYDYDPPEEGDFLEKENLALIKPSRAAAPNGEAAAGSGKTTGRALKRLGLAPEENVKGTQYDRDRQPRCFQFVPFNVFARKYYLASHSEEEYRKRTLDFFREKIDRMGELIAAYTRDGSHRNVLKG